MKMMISVMVVTKAAENPTKQAHCFYCAINSGDDNE